MASPTNRAENLRQREMLVRQEIPEIDGSSAGFIVLIVALCLIIIGSCVAVYVLLRNHTPSEEDRAIRRQRSRRFREQPAPEFAYSSSSGGKPSWRNRFDNIFSLGKKIDVAKGYKSRKSGRGWVQASGEEWDSESDHEELVERGQAGGQQMHRFGPRDRDVEIADSPPQGTRPESRLDSEYPGYLQGPFSDPFSKDLLSATFGFPRAQIESPPAMFPSPPSTSHSSNNIPHDSDHDIHDPGLRPSSTTSTLSRGTKFIESL